VAACGLLHSWIVMRGLAGICSIWRDKFSLLVPRIEYGGGFADFGSVAVLIHTWVTVEETFNPLGVSLGASLESRCCHLILNSSV
jgi:hypothetical protein